MNTPEQNEPYLPAIQLLNTRKSRIEVALKMAENEVKRLKKELDAFDHAIYTLNHFQDKQ